ncbi:DUF4276 family protein [Nocardia pneumoniae]|uniref:DUF4276 family protein n=1 Tax=Nocardia pneumoniae TaxID=228601 RepID=UPI0003087D5F|nr:DUF4276 family protein [Nocardia pneumoniae]
MTATYHRLHLLVEGQSEEIVVSNVLGPYLAERGWTVTHSIVTTKRPAGGPNHRGGVSSWSKIEREIKLLLRDSSLRVLSTLFDFYAFPPDSPGMADIPPGLSPHDRVQHVERSLAIGSADPRFLPHLILHEMETWVFAAAEQVGHLLPGLTERLVEDVQAAGGPELVNDGPETAPSKRILNYCPQYSKTTDGPLAIADLGVDALRAQCPHLDRWLSMLDSCLQ